MRSVKVLLICSTAREHAIAEALSRSATCPDIVSLCPQRNPGLEQLSSTFHVGNILDFPWVLKIAKAEKPDLAIIGPDDPIGAGLADLLEEQGIPTVAPKKSLARIESSKSFARDLLNKYAENSSPKFRVYSEFKPKEMSTFIDRDLQGEYVIKYDALRGGKGVKVSGEHLSNIEEALAYAKECIDECGKVVIEEKLIGVEFSLLSFVSGKHVVDMPAVQDHKRAYDGDTGPNTGGMGTYTDADHSLPFLTNEDLQRASDMNRTTAEALLSECGEPFKGILYGGFIAVKDGVKVIEFNARFGDPESLNLLPLLRSDIVPIFQAITTGELTEDLVSFDHLATVCTYITPLSYPLAKNEKGQEVTFPAIPENARLFFGDILKDDEGKLRLGGSRTAGIVGIGDTLEEAQSTVQLLCKQVKGPVRFRSDIGTEKLIGSRKETMKRLRQGASGVS